MIKKLPLIRDLSSTPPLPIHPRFVLGSIFTSHLLAPARKLEVGSKCVQHLSFLDMIFTEGFHLRKISL